MTAISPVDTDPMALITMLDTPIRLALFEVVADHPGLAEGEAGEDTEGVQRDQLGDVAVEDDDQDAGDRGEEDHAVGEHQPGAAVEELAWQEPVPGDDRCQSGEVGVGRVGGQDQDQERADHHHPEHDALAAVEVFGHQPQPVAVVSASVRLEMRRQHRHAEEARAEDHAHPHQCLRCVLALRAPECRHAVRDGFDSRQTQRRPTRTPAANMYRLRAGVALRGRDGSRATAGCRVSGRRAARRPGRSPVPSRISSMTT